MLDQLFGLVLLGLGLQPPSFPAVKGLETEQTRASNSAVDVARIKDREEKLKEIFEARQEKLKENLEKRHEASEVQHLKERASFEKKLKNISDVQKRVVALKVDSKIPELNKRLTTNMTERLMNMQKVLERASLRLAEHKSASSSADTRSVESEVAAAQASITSALGVVSTQSQKTYTAEAFSSEENLGTTMKALISEFHSDIKNARTMVNAAKAHVVTVLEHIGALL